MQIEVCRIIAPSYLVHTSTNTWYKYRYKIWALVAYLNAICSDLWRSLEMHARDLEYEFDNILDEKPFS